MRGTEMRKVRAAQARTYRTAERRRPGADPRRSAIPDRRERRLFAFVTLTAIVCAIGPALAALLVTKL